MGFLSRFAVLHPWRAIGAWVVLMVLVIGGSARFAGTLNDSFSLPDTESTTAQHLLEKAGTSQAAGGAEARIVVSPSTGRVTAPAVAAVVSRLARDVAAVPAVACVADPLGRPVGSDCPPAQPAPDTSQLTAAQKAAAAAAAQVFSPVSKDAAVAYLTVSFTSDDPSDVPVADAKRVLALVKAANGTAVGSGTLSVGANGDVLTYAGVEPPSSEAVGILVALVILLFAFGSLVGAFLPIVSAVLSLGLGLSLVNLVARWLDVATFAPTLAAMIGLGVGIDYSLFVINRFRQALEAGREPRPAALESVRTAGRAVQFAATTVVIALLGLFVMRIGFFNGLAVAAAVTVLMVMLGALWLLPAVLSLLGRRAFAIRMPWVPTDSPFVSRRSSHHGAAGGLGHGLATGVRWVAWVVLFPVSLIGLGWRRLRRDPTSDDGGAFGRHGTRLQRRPWLTGAIALVAMVVIALPTLSLRLGFSDDSGTPVGSAGRTAYELLSKGFGPGSNGPFFVAAQLPAPGDAAGVPALVRGLSADPGVADAVSFPASGAQAAKATVETIIVIPRTAPQDVATSELLDRLRTDVIPPATRDSRIKAYVGGTQAITQDFTQVLVDKLPLFLAIVVGLGFLVLVVLFRSLVVPLTAALTSLLSLSASLGITVAIFQWGWLADVLGVSSTGPIFPFLPIMVFSILFGLSMDYQVFLVTRMQEEWLHTGDNRVAVRRGLVGSGRVVAIAAAIMTSVFAAFIPTPDATIKLFGISLASAVVLDAFVVRLVLVPSIMTILGRANWWLPGWLDRLLPHVAVEHAEEAAVPAARRGDAEQSDLEGVGRP